MNKKELIVAVARQAGISNADAARAVDAALKAITNALKKGDSVTLVGFGTFEVRKRAARIGRNPKTGTTLKIHSAKTPSFRSGGKLRQMVEEGTDDPGPSIAPKRIHR